MARVDAPPSPATDATGTVGISVDGDALEKRGRAWLLWSFVLCPCHLPWTLAVLATVAGGTSLGVLVRDHAWVAGILISAAWIGGTAYGLRLIRRAERAGGACSVRTPRTP